MGATAPSLFLLKFLGGGYGRTGHGNDCYILTGRIWHACRTLESSSTGYGRCGTVIFCGKNYSSYSDMETKATN